MIPLADQVACIERELAMRRRVYPRWVMSGRMKQDAADREIARMEAVLATLRACEAEAAKRVAIREALGDERANRQLWEMGL